MSRPRRLLVAVGEASGDQLAARLIAQLGDVEACGVVGPALRDRGVRALDDLEGLQAVGLLDGARAAAGAQRRVRALVREARAWRPDAMLTVDAPSFTLRAARRVRRLGVPVVHVGAPQVWAWRPGRARRLGEAVDELVCLLPFEPPWFQGHLPARFLGHPATALPTVPPAATPTVALLPGSRPAEVRRLWPTMRATAAALARQRPEVRFVVVQAPTVPRLGGLAARRVHRIEDVADAHAALVASGTATLQLAAMGIGQVIVYRTDPLTWWVGQRVVRTPFVGLPNLVAGRREVPEHLQHLDPDRLATAVLAQMARRPEPLDLRGDGAVPRIAEVLRRWLEAPATG